MPPPTHGCWFLARAAGDGAAGDTVVGSVRADVGVVERYRSGRHGRVLRGTSSPPPGPSGCDADGPGPRSGLFWRRAVSRSAGARPSKWTDPAGASRGVPALFSDVASAKKSRLRILGLGLSGMCCGSRSSGVTQTTIRSGSPTRPASASHPAKGRRSPLTNTRDAPSSRLQSSLGPTR